MLSLVSSWVGDDMRARVYGVIQIVENVGMLVAEPLLQSIFAASLKLSRPWSSLVFLVAAVCTSLLAQTLVLTISGSIRCSRDMHYVYEAGLVKFNIANGKSELLAGGVS